MGLGQCRPPKSNCSDGAFEDGIDYYNQNQQTQAPAKSVGDCCALCAARAGCNAYTIAGNTCYMKANADGRRSNPNCKSGVCKKTPVDPTTNCKNGKCVKFVDSSTVDMTTALSGADVALVFVGTSSSEGGDRRDLSLGSQDKLIQSVAKVLGKKTVVVAVTPGALLTPWSSDVGAVLTPFMPGQEYGNAIGDILFGDTNPSARLPITFPNAENEMQMTPEMYPGKNGISIYSEALEVGYRWYNSHGIKPAFAFGHGLSYTTFQYDDLKVNGRSVSFSVKNVGKLTGSEIPQLYVTFPESAKEPPRQLKGFKKVALEAGGTTVVTFQLTDRDLSIWDGAGHDWSLVTGEFDVMVGASSDDIRLTGKLSSSSVVTV